MKKNVLRLTIAIMSVLFLSTAGWAQAPSAGNGKKPTKTRDRLRLHYGQVDETYVDGTLESIHCHGAGDMKCRAETGSYTGSGYTETDMNYLNELSDDIVDGLLALHPTGEPPIEMNGYDTKLATLMLPDGTEIHRLYRVDWEWAVGGAYSEESSYTDL